MCLPAAAASGTIEGCTQGGTAMSTMSTPGVAMSSSGLAATVAHPESRGDLRRLRLVDVVDSDDAQARGPVRRQVGAAHDAAAADDPDAEVASGSLGGDPPARLDAVDLVGRPCVRSGRAHPFTAPNVRPRVRLRCIASTNRMAGIIISTDIAAMPRQSTVNWLVKSKRPTGNVLAAGVLVMMLAIWYSFQAARNAKTDAAPSPGSARGRSMRQKVCQWLAPST